MSGISMDHFLVARGLLGDKILTDQLLKEIIGTLSTIDKGATAEILEQVRKKLEATVGISMSTGEGISDRRMEPWLGDRKASIQWDYWNSYKQHLMSEGYSSTVIRALDEDTDNVLTECGNPETPGSWGLRGLVMGDVQSGKTGNYCGLIAKASDAGYKVVVLLTGTIEELRAQTQSRLDEGYVGKSSRDILGAVQSQTRIGAGLFRQKTPNVLTSVDTDFLTANGRALQGIPLENINQPALFVIKKNKSALQNCITFFKTQLPAGHKQLNVPLLVIDDEADNASVNAKKDDDPATINLLIRSLLSGFSRSSYVAYTATPFANVFINPDIQDLFPSDFIYALNPPSNYVGVQEVFSDTGKHADQVEQIEDADDAFPFTHKKEHQVRNLPSTLKDAIRTFLISCAIRDIRQELLKHRSMLINVSRFTNVQSQVSALVKEYLHELTEAIRQYAASDHWQGNRELAELHKSWQIHYSGFEQDWDKLRHALHDATASVKVITINQKTEATDRLNYNQFKKTEKGRRAIAVGGLTLSRGLTLEGLCVSYFYRNSKAYDTLLQMGRWFGYRTDYDDLFKIWMDNEVRDWFGHIATAVDELKSDLRRMHANRLPPSQFGIRVRSKPETLLVTALNKMRNAEEIEHRVSFSGYGAETPFLPRSEKKNRENVEIAGRFIASLGQPKSSKETKHRHFWSNVPGSAIASFLGRLSIEGKNIEFIADASGKGNPLISFIGGNTINELQNWDVSIPSGEGSKVNFGDTTATDIYCRKRQFEFVSEASTYLKLNRQRVGDSSDESIGLDPSDIPKVKVFWDSERQSDPKKGKAIPGKIFRRYRTRPLLTIHFIEPAPPSDDTKVKRKTKMMHPDEIKTKTLVAVGVSFPEFDGEGEVTTIPYRLNKVALRTLGYYTDDDDDDQD